MVRVKLTSDRPSGSMSCHRCLRFHRTSRSCHSTKWNDEEGNPICKLASSYVFAPEKTAAAPHAHRNTPAGRRKRAQQYYSDSQSLPWPCRGGGGKGRGSTEMGINLICFEGLQRPTFSKRAEELYDVPASQRRPGGAGPASMRSPPERKPSSPGGLWLPLAAAGCRLSEHRTSSGSAAKSGHVAGAFLASKDAKICLMAMDTIASVQMHFSCITRPSRSLQARAQI